MNDSIRTGKTSYDLNTAWYENAPVSSAECQQPTL